MSRKIYAMALGALISAPLLAQGQTGVGTSAGTVVPGRRMPQLDTIKAMLDRRNPTLDELMMLSAEVAKRIDEYKVAIEKMRQGGAGGGAMDEVRIREMMATSRQRLEELSAWQKLLATSCALLQPHEGESQGVLGFQIESATNFQYSSPAVKEERFVRAPMIAFVDPKSPAAKEGVREGDYWLAIGGKDIVNTYVRELSDIVKPGARIELKLRRDGRDLTVAVVAVRRPEYPTEACRNQAFDLQGKSSVGPIIQFRSVPQGGTDFFTAKTVAKTFIDGALFSELTNEKRTKFNVPLNEGVLVESVAPGSPAEMAGLRDYDVVSRANNQTIDSVLDLMKILREGGPITFWVVQSQKKVVLPGR